MAQGLTPSSGERRQHTQRRAWASIADGASHRLSIRSMAFSGKGPFTLELRVRSTGAGMGQVFWTTSGKRNFHRDRSVTFPVTHDGAWHDHAVKLPVEEAIMAVRIDPGTAPGEIAIRDLRLKDVEGTMIKEWDFRRP